MDVANILSAAKKALGFSVEKKGFTLNDASAFDLFGVRSTYSGFNMGGKNALFVPAVLQAVRLISESVGSLPVKLFHETETGKKALKDHPAYRIVHKHSNDWTGASAFRTSLTVDALLHGSGFARVIRYPDDGKPFSLERIDPSKVTILENTLTGAPVYRVSESAGLRDYAHTDILHVPSFLGTSPITFGKEAIGLAAILERHGARFFSSGARPTGIISNEKPQGSDAGARAISNILNSYNSWLASDGSAPLILDCGWKYQSPVMTSTDAQFLEHRVEQVREVARIFGVPPTMLFELTRGTWSNTEQMGAQFLQLCLRPWLDRWQEAFATVLLSEDEKSNCYFEFIIDDLLRADAQARTANMTALVTNRIMTPNEVRAILNLQPLPGGDELSNPFTTSSAQPNTNPASPKEPA